MKWFPLYDWRTRNRLGATAQVLWTEGTNQHYSKTTLSKHALVSFPEEAEELLRFTARKILTRAFDAALNDSPLPDEVTYLVKVSRREELVPFESITMQASVVEVQEEP